MIGKRQIHVNGIEVTKKGDVTYETQFVQKLGLAMVGAFCIAM